MPVAAIHVDVQLSTCFVVNIMRKYIAALNVTISVCDSGSMWYDCYVTLYHNR